MLSVIMLSVIMLSVIMLSVMATWTIINADEKRFIIVQQKNMKN